MARAEFKVDVSALKILAAKTNDPNLRAELERVASRKEVAALVAQAIADNFAKEGPGWAPLKGATIRRSVAMNKATRALLKDAKMYAARKMGSIRKGKNGYRIDQKDLKGRKAEFYSHVDKYIENVEKASRVNPDPNEALGNRQILQRTGLLMKTVTTPGASGSVKNGKKTISGSNIYRVEGTTLIWGTNLIYAGVHQNGDPSRNIPQRQFLYLQQEWKNRLNAYALKLAKQVISGKLT